MKAPKMVDASIVVEAIQHDVPHADICRATGATHEQLTAWCQPDAKMPAAAARAVFKLLTQRVMEVFGAR